MSFLRKAAVLSVALALFAIACGPDDEQIAADPTETAEGPSAEGTAAPDADATATEGGDATEAALSGYDAVFAEIEGLDQEARWDRLVELAEQEEGTFQVYATISGDEIGPVMEDFVATTGSSEIETEHYRAGSVELLERITQEAAAGQQGADAVVTIAIDLGLLGNEGLLQPFETPVADDVPEDLVFEDWASIYINAYAPARNTDLVSEADAPRTWEELLSYTAQPIAIEVQSYDLFATLVTKHFMDEKGMSEEEAVALFTEAPADLIPVPGRDALAEFVVAGEYGMAVGTYTQSIANFEDSAPIAWEPPVEPLVQRPNGVAPMTGTDMPATALLFVDYMLSEAGQQKLASFDRIPTNTNVEGNLPEQYDVITVDVEAILDNRQKWTDLYSQVTGEPVEGAAG